MRSALWLSLALSACGAANPTAPSDVPLAESSGGDAEGPGPVRLPDEGSGTAPADTVALAGSLPAATGSATVTVDGVARQVQVVVPSSRTAHPALVVAFHGTGGTPADFFAEAGLVPVAEEVGFVLLGPQALERNGGRGEAGDPDHYEGSEGYGTSWNLADKDPDRNNDVRLVRALIQAARQAYGVNSDRVYVLGHSNGGFFAWHVAALLNDRVAAFASNSGGATRCANRGPEESQFTGRGATCDALEASQGYPRCDGDLQSARVPSGRRPWGFLTHAPDDRTVSAAHTCMLARALGPRATVHLQPVAAGETFGHAVVEGFAPRSWAFFRQHARTE